MLCANQPSLDWCIGKHPCDPTVEKGLLETWTPRRDSLSSPLYTCPVLWKEEFLLLKNGLRFLGAEIPRFGSPLVLRGLKLQVSGVPCPPGCVASPMRGGRETSAFILARSSCSTCYWFGLAHQQATTKGKQGHCVWFGRDFGMSVQKAVYNDVWPSCCSTCQWRLEPGVQLLHKDIALTLLAWPLALS